MFVWGDNLLLGKSGINYQRHPVDGQAAPARAARGTGRPAWRRRSVASNNSAPRITPAPPVGIFELLIATQVFTGAPRQSGAATLVRSRRKREAKHALARALSLLAADAPSNATQQHFQPSTSMGCMRGTFDLLLFALCVSAAAECPRRHVAIGRGVASPQSFPAMTENTSDSCSPGRAGYTIARAVAVGTAT